jgi:hypothetical protein
MKNNLNFYALASQVTNNQLSRREYLKTKKGGGELSKVAWYEYLVDVIHEAQKFAGIYALNAFRNQTR